MDDPARQSMPVSVIGCGYLGITTAACLAQQGHDVIALDIDPDRIALLADGGCPVYEPNLADLVGRGVASGRLRFTTSYAEVAEVADVHLICVGTPQARGDVTVDLTQVDAVAAALFPALSRPVAVVGKSTVPVGTAARLRASLAASAPDAVLAWCPEFVREGHAVDDTLRPSRIVIGTDDPTSPALAVVRRLYDSATYGETPTLWTDLATAELVKGAANSFLATKISFINAVAEVCEVAGADIDVVADALGLDPRIGRAFLDAGIGYGGGCLPKDLLGFIGRAAELGAAESVALLREVHAINQRQRQKMVDLATEVLHAPIVGARIAVLGAAFKPGSDDIRDSPALDIAGQLQLRGAIVSVYDPKATIKAERNWPTLRFATSVKEACADADVVLVLTEWPEFVDLDPVELAAVVDDRRVIDGRNCLDARSWRDAGWRYHSLGRRTTSG